IPEITGQKLRPDSGFVGEELRVRLPVRITAHMDPVLQTNGHEDVGLDGPVNGHGIGQDCVMYGGPSGNRRRMSEVEKRKASRLGPHRHGLGQRGEFLVYHDNAYIDLFQQLFQGLDLDHLFEKGVPSVLEKRIRESFRRSRLILAEIRPARTCGGIYGELFQEPGLFRCTRGQGIPFVLRKQIIVGDYPVLEGIEKREGQETIVRKQYQAIRMPFGKGLDDGITLFPHIEQNALRLHAFPPFPEAPKIRESTAGNWPYSSPGPRGILRWRRARLMAGIRCQLLTVCRHLSSICSYSCHFSKSLRTASGRIPSQSLPEPPRFR